MLVVSVDLISAITGEKRNLGKVIIANDGTGTDARGNYFARAFRAGTSLIGWHNKKPTRTGSVTNYPRKAEPVWSLVTQALLSLGYGGQYGLADQLPHIYGPADDRRSDGSRLDPCDQQSERQAP